MSWQTPKTNWAATDGVANTDLNRIEGNIAAAYVPSGITTNTGNVYSVTLNNYAAYTDLSTITVKFNAASTGAITLNVNGLGAKNVVDYFGNAVTNVRANLIATLGYDATSGNFILRGKGGGGNATTDQVLSGRTFTTDAGSLTGTMPNKAGTTTAAASYSTDGAGNLNISPSLGYYDGNIATQTQINDPDFVAGNVVNGKNLFGLVGTFNKIYGPGDVVPSGNIKQSAKVSCGMVTGAAGTLPAIFDPNNPYVYTFDSSNYIRKFNYTTGTQVWSSSGTAGCSDWTIGKDGNLYGTYTGQGYYMVNASTGVVSSFNLGTWYATCVVSGGDGFLYFGTSNGSILKVAEGGTSTISASVASGIGNNIYSMAMDSAGNFYCGASSSSFIYKVLAGMGTTGSSYISGLTGGVGLYKAIFIDKVTNNLYVADGTTLKKYNSSGTLQWSKASLAPGGNVFCPYQDSNGYIYCGVYIGGTATSYTCMKFDGNGNQVWEYRQAGANVGNGRWGYKNGLVAMPDVYISSMTIIDSSFTVVS